VERNSVPAKSDNQPPDDLAGIGVLHLPVASDVDRRTGRNARSSGKAETRLAFGQH
jgi:hypothetical protein